MVSGMKQSILDPVRIVHFIIHLSAVVIVAAYSAALISFLTVNTFIMPFTTMDGLLKDKTYRFGVIGDSADFSFFQVLKIIPRLSLLQNQRSEKKYITYLK